MLSAAIIHLPPVVHSDILFFLRHHKCNGWARLADKTSPHTHLHCDLFSASAAVARQPYKMLCSFKTRPCVPLRPGPVLFRLRGEGYGSLAHTLYAHLILHHLFAQHFCRAQSRSDSHPTLALVYAQHLDMYFDRHGNSHERWLRWFRLDLLLGECQLGSSNGGRRRCLIDYNLNIHSVLTHTLLSQPGYN